MSTDLDSRIEEALEQVCDPCSIAARAPLSILDMGLVEGWNLDGEGNLRVRMCVTSASCTMAPHMVRAAEAELSKVAELKSVTVEVDATVFWTPARMSVDGRRELEARRRQSMVTTGVRPQQWRSARQRTS